jgi:AcrR family transcriptional regulator
MNRTETASKAATESGAPRRRRLRAHERRDSILSAANTVFGQRGYETVRIDDVAAAAGISKALIYEHFRSKQELYSELMNRAAIEMLDRIVTASGGPELSGAQRLERGAEAGFAFVTSEPEAFQMCVRDVSDPEIAAQQAILRRGAVAAMIDVMRLEPAATRTDLTPANLEQVAEMLVGGFYSLAEWWLQNRETDVSELIRMMLSFMWLGLGRMQEGERWTLGASGGNAPAAAEQDSHGSPSSADPDQD